MSIPTYNVRGLIESLMISLFSYFAGFFLLFSHFAGFGGCSVLVLVGIEVVPALPQIVVRIHIGRCFRRFFYHFRSSHKDLGLLGLGSVREELSTPTPAGIG